MAMNQRSTPTTEHSPQELGPEPIIVLPAADPSEGERGSGFTRLRLLLDHRRFLARVTVWGCAISLITAFVIPKQYESKTLLMPPEQSRSNLGSMLALAGRSDIAAIAGDWFGMTNSGSLFIGILQSRTVEERIIGQFDLRRVYGESRMEEARKELERNTYAVEDRKSGIISITVTDHDPHRAAEMGKAYVDELNRLVSELNTSSAHREKAFLEDRLKSVKVDLDAAARDFSEFASKNAAIDIKEQGKAMVGAAATLEGELIAAQSEQQGLRQIYSDDNVRVRALGARITELQRKLNQIGGGAAESAISAQDGDEHAYPSIRKLPLLGVTYEELYRRTKIQETISDLLTQEYELAKVEEAKETPSVKVLDPPSVPEKKSFPPRLLIIALGTCLSFVFGALWLWGNSIWQETDSQNPAKSFLADAYAGVKSDFSAESRQGFFQRMRNKISRSGSHTE